MVRTMGEVEHYFTATIIHASYCVWQGRLTNGQANQKRVLSILTIMNQKIVLELY